MPDVDMIRELRLQARMYNQAADLLEGKTERGTGTTTTRTTTPGNGRQMSAAGRRKIAIAQRKRWALVRGGKKAA